MNERWSRVKELFGEGVGLTPPARQAWIDAACAGDAALRAEVEALLRAHDEAGDFMAAPAVADTSAAGALLAAAGTAPPALPERCGAYRIVRELGRGGMGVVYLGLRDDALFDKAVAIKIASSDRVHPAVFERFQEERRILASLDHANIARLLDAGTTESGVAYVVMEYVDGVTIDAYCAQRRLGVRERLALFVQVCAAVQYSHQHLVVHRDLKPRNILVTADGAPKLLDFGIAKLLEPGRDGQDATRTAFRALTPENASPEQVRGDPITVASDVYALGVLLYRLLAERSPYRGDLGTQAGLVHAVCEEEPLRPSETAGRAELRGDLDLVTLKALRKDPARRYASVEQLAQDVRRHLERRPVLAAPDAWTYRARKFAARHGVGLAAGAAVVLALAGGGAAARWQARRAERRFNDVRRLAHTLMFDVHDAIATLPGSTAARRLLVTNALQYLDSLSQEAGGDASLQRELATAYDRMADVLGRPASANLGDAQGALAAYRKGQAARERLLAGDPGNRELRRDLAATSSKMGLVLFHVGELPAGVEEARKAVALEEALAASHPGSPRLPLAASYSAYGYLLGASGRTVESVAALRQAVALLEPLQAGDRDVQLQLALTYAYYGDVLEGGQLAPGVARDLDALVDMRRKSVALEEPLAAAQPLNTALQRRMFMTRVRLADALGRQGDGAGSVAENRRALAHAERVAADDPANVQAASDVSFACERLAQRLVRSGEPDQALALLQRAAKQVEPIAARDAANLSTRSRAANIDMGLGYAHAALGDRSAVASEAKREHWREARARFQAARAFWAEMRDRRLSTGEEAEWPDVLAREIARCDAALAAAR
jgi:non-specific serine/threonine protein kinase/serine/threonine-protein kinase